MLVDDLQYQTPLGKSDHVCLVWNYIVSVEEQETQQRKFNYWKGDYNKINADLGSHDWEKIIGNDTVNDAWNKFKRILQETVDRNIPLLGIRKEKKSRNPWLTKATKRYISKRNKAWRKFNDLKTESNYSIYKKLRNEANKRVKIDQSVYRKKILRSFKGNHKKFYGYMRKLKTVKERVHQIKSDNDELTTTDEEAAQVLGKFFSSVFLNERDGHDTQSEEFVQEEYGWNIIINEDTVMNKLMGLKEDKSPGPDNIHSALLRNCARTVAVPLTIIYQKSFSEGTLPDDWKTATVIPIFKKGNKHEAGNYRPVSLTSVPCKVLESIIRDTVVARLDKQGFYDDCQHGFVKGRSTLTNLLETIEAWTRIIEEGLGLDVIYLD